MDTGSFLAYIGVFQSWYLLYPEAAMQQPNLPGAPPIVSGRPSPLPTFADPVPLIPVRPIIKWAGGKAQLLPTLHRFLPRMDRVRRYFEPFLGGAAMFFSLQHPHSYLSDTNAELINLYEVVRDHTTELIAALRRHVYARDHYFAVRAQDPTTLSPIERSARLIYLNKTCFNGLYRVNRHGQFNVPLGRYTHPTICDAPNLEAATRALRPATLILGEYGTVLRDAGPGDFVYFDPPYHPLSPTATFTSYTDRSFDANEQVRLAQAFRGLHAAGCYLMQSNSDTPLIHELYAGFRIARITAKRAINSRVDRRGPISELVITNYAEDGELLASLDSYRPA
jgi:DNA adenine methylase